MSRISNVGNLFDRRVASCVAHGSQARLQFDASDLQGKKETAINEASALLVSVIKRLHSLEHFDGRQL